VTFRSCLLYLVIKSFRIFSKSLNDLVPSGHHFNPYRTTQIHKVLRHSLLAPFIILIICSSLCVSSTDALPTIRYKIPASISCDGFKKQPVIINGSKSKYSINCIVIGGTIKNILIANASNPTLSVLVSNTTNGKLTIQLPRELIDSRKEGTSDEDALY